MSHYLRRLPEYNHKEKFGCIVLVGVRKETESTTTLNTRSHHSIEWIVSYSEDTRLRQHNQPELLAVERGLTAREIEEIMWLAELTKCPELAKTLCAERIEGLQYQPLPLLR